MSECPYCGGKLEYVGIEEGGGDYADSLVDLWYCHECDIQLEGAEMRLDDESED